MRVLFAWAVWALSSASAFGAEPEARVVALTSSGGPRSVTLEWRRIENGATHRLGERPITLQGRTALPIGLEERVLRIHEAGAAPRSYYVPEGTESLSFDLGAAAPGGEVFGLLAARRVRPHAIRLAGQGGSRESRPDGDGVFGMAGLSPGAYSLTPIYRGGVEGRETRIIVRAGQTAELLPLDLAEVGSVRVDLGTLCGEQDLKLRLDGPAGTRGYASSLALGDCVPEMDGLAPGSWRGAVTRGGARNEPRGSAEFAVAAGERTDVRFEAVVRVAGTVTAGGAPVAGMRLVFEQGVGRWSIATDSRGAYEVMLGPPGEYAVSVLASRDLPSRAFSRTFGPGDHQEDVELGLGSIEVTVRAESGGRLDEAVELALFETDGRRVSGRFDVREGRAVFTGLEYGEYTVTGRTASGLRSRNAAGAELAAESPVARVELLMGRGQGVLKVVGPAGTPLAGARASAGQAALPEREAGTFDLAGVPRGERIVAHAPDHVPVCRIVDTTDGFVVRLPVADGPFTLRLAAGAPWRDALLSDLAGSDCPVAIDDVEPQVRTEEHAVTVVLQLPRGAFRIALDGQMHSASAPGELDIP